MQPTNAQPTEIRWYNAVTNQLLATTPGYVNNFEWTPICPSRPTTNSTDCISVYAEVVACNTIQSNTSGGIFRCFTKIWDTQWACPLFVNKAQQIDEQPKGIDAITIYPNPASTRFMVTLKNGNNAKNGIKQVKVLDKTGGIKKIQSFSNTLKSQSINILGLRPGVYTVIVSDGKKEYTSKVIVL